MRLSHQRPPSAGTAEPCVGSAHWRYRAASWRPSPSCAAQRTSAVSVASAVSQQDPDTRSGNAGGTSPATVYMADVHGHDAGETGDRGRQLNYGPTEARGVLHEAEPSLVLHQQDVLGQLYSSATVSAMARLIGQNDHSEQLLAAGQASVVILPKLRLLDVLKAGSGTPLDEASAALALLCEAGQYDAVVQHGNPLLKAASAAVPFSPLSVGKQHQPVPHLEHLASDLALSIALAHISLAGGAGAGSGSGSAVTSGDLDGLEQVYGHLESALQVLERHSVAAPLQQEVAYCLQAVAAAFTEEVLRSTPPVASPPRPSAAAGGAAPGRLAPSASAGAAAVTGAAGAAGGTAGSASGPSSPAAAAARRAKAISVLRSVLWRGAPQSRHNNHSQSQQQHDSHGAQGGVAAAAAMAVESSGAPAIAPGNVGAGVGVGGGWVPELTSEERTELMAPLRGLLAASEHIALYGPVASGQKPYSAVQLSDEELYDLAIAHLAQGVSTGWPQHVLQALSYFERIAQQQQHGAGAGGAAAAAAAVDVSFERSVCEALLGRRTTSAGPPADLPPASAPAGRAASGSASLPYSLSCDEWYDDGDESALLRRLEAQLLLAANGGAVGASAAGPGALEGLADGSLSFSVKESSDGAGSEYEGDATDAVRAPAAGPAVESGAAAPARAAAAASNKAPTTAPATEQKATQPAQQPRQSSARARPKSDRKDNNDDVARKYGWAESWLELSVMPCFPETAGAGSVSLARWFADPRVVLFNKLLAVRSGEAQVTAALGSAVAHVSDASRQRLWQLWQAAAHAVSSAGRGHGGQSQSQAAPGSAKEVAAAPEVVLATGSGAKGGGGGGSSGSAAPLASGLLAQSRSALQDVAPRAAAAASAVAAAAAAVGSAAASSPRAVAAAAGWMVPFARWGSAEKPTKTVNMPTAAPGGGGGGRTAVAAQALPRAAAAATAEPVTTTTSGDEDVASRTGGTYPHQLQSNASNVVPFPAGVAAAGGGPGPGNGGGPGPGNGGAVVSSPMTTVPAAPPVAGGLVDVVLAAPPAGGGGGAAAAEADSAAAGSLWAPDAEGHLRPRPRMVTHVVQHAAAAAASIKERVAALPGAGPVRDWAAIALDPAAADEATSREAVRRVAAVAAQAVCLGALAAYVGNRIVASGALQAAAASGYGAAASAAAPTVDSSRAQVAAAARAVARWLGDAGMGAAAQEALGQWPLLGAGSGRQAELRTAGAEAASIESVGRLAEEYGRRAQLDETAAAAMLRGWAAARAAAPALADPRDRAELLSGLLGGRALKAARAEADRNARMGRRIELQRVDVELEQLRCRPSAADAAAAAGAAAGAEVVVTAAVATAGTETSRASPLPLSYCTRERLRLTFRRESAEAASPAAVRGPVWRLVDVRDAPPALY